MPKIAANEVFALQAPTKPLGSLEFWVGALELYLPSSQSAAYSVVGNLPTVRCLWAAGYSDAAGDAIALLSEGQHQST